MQSRQWVHNRAGFAVGLPAHGALPTGTVIYQRSKIDNGTDNQSAIIPRKT